MLASIAVKTSPRVAVVTGGAVRVIASRWNGERLSLDSHGWSLGVTGKKSALKPGTLIVQLVGEDRQVAGQPERADPADCMAGQGQRGFRIEHPRASAEFGLAPGVIQPCLAAREQQVNRLADLERQGLGNPPRLHAKHFSRLCHGRG